MKNDLEEILACPICKNDLELNIKTKDEKEVLTGSFYCTECNNLFHIYDGVPNFMPPQRIISGGLYKRWRRASRAHYNFYRRRHLKFTQSDEEMQHTEEKIRQEAYENVVTVRAYLVERWRIPLINPDEMCILEIAGSRFPDEVFIDVKMRHKIVLEPIVKRLISHDCELLQAMAEYIPLKSDIIDLCSITNTIDHTADPLSVLHEIHRVLTKDGILFISCNVFNSWLRPAFPILDRLEAPHPYHFTSSSFVRMLVTAGFEYEVIAVDKVTPSTCKAKVGRLCGVGVITLRATPKK